VSDRPCTLAKVRKQLTELADAAAAHGSKTFSLDDLDCQTVRSKKAVPRKKRTSWMATVGCTGMKSDDMAAALAAAGVEPPRVEEARGNWIKLCALAKRHAIDLREFK
jgi:hypothetical protein